MTCVCDVCVRAVFGCAVVRVDVCVCVFMHMCFWRACVAQHGDEAVEFLGAMSKVVARSPGPVPADDKVPLLRARGRADA